VRAKLPAAAMESRFDALRSLLTRRIAGWR
jgi:hypothetical protein